VSESESDKRGRSGRWQRREQRRRSQRSRIKKHGAGLSSAYAAAIRKRLRDKTNKH
jgi:hypothetical protein